MRVKLVAELRKHLRCNQSEEIENKELKKIVNAIRNFARQEMGFKANQSFIRIKHLFGVITIKAWFGANFGARKCIECGRTIVKRSLNCCWACQLDRNEALDDSILQRDRIKSWHESKKERAMNGQHPHAMKHARENVSGNNCRF